MSQSSETSTKSNSLGLSDRYEYYQGIHVLRLSGSFYDMGYQHGKLLEQAIKRGTLPYFSKYVTSLLSQVAGKGAGKLLGKALKNLVGKKIAEGFPTEALQTLEGLADGAGLSRKELMDAVVMPETFLWLVTRSMLLKPLEKSPRFSVPFFGCSTIIASGKATQDGKLLHGRNFDYQGVGAWDRETAVIFHAPEHGQKYVSIASAGIIMGGGTAMNESGLTLAVHQHLSSDSLRLGGMPVGVIGDKIMREAHNLEDTIRVLDGHQSIGCWTYLITSAKEKKTLCYEVSGTDRAFFIVDADTFGYTNLYLNQRMAESEYHLYPSQWRSNTGRYHCIQDRLSKSSGNISEQTIATMLGDRNNPDCRLSEPISMLLTVGSVVFKAEDGLFFVGSGKAPTSNRDFIAFDLNIQGPRKDLSPLDGKIGHDKEALDAFDSYRDSYESYFNDFNIDMARFHLDKAIAKQPKETLYHYVAGLLALSDQSPDSAIESFSKGLEIGHHSPERVAALYLWRARAYDLRKERDFAIKDYNRALSGDQGVHKAALKGLTKSWEWKALNIEYNYADIINP